MKPETALVTVLKIPSNYNLHNNVKSLVLTHSMVIKPQENVKIVILPAPLVMPLIPVFLVMNLSIL
jgi:hypothetical protein